LRETRDLLENETIRRSDVVQILLHVAEMPKTKPVRAAKPTTSTKKKRVVRFSRSKRLFELRRALATPHGMTLAQICSTFECERHTARRMIASLEELGEAISEEQDGRTKTFRLPVEARGLALKLSLAHVLAIRVAQQVLDFLEGTTIKEGFDELVEQLEATLQKKPYAHLRNLDKKILVVNDAPYESADRSDAVDAVITALTNEERLHVRRASAGKEERAFDVEPHTLLVYKKGLYVHGYSHHHQQVRTFSLDTFADVDWKRGDAFAYPVDWDPRRRFSGAFTLFDGPETRVRIRFAAKVAKYAVRRRWHSSKKVEEHADGSVVLSFVVNGTTEMTSWILGWGANAEVLEPGALRDEIAETAAAIVRLYAPKTT
jgi:predicted DNA-binding transcriptional regulator YafY